VTRRYEEVRHAALLAGQTCRAEPCHPGGLALYQIVRPVGLYICIAAVFQRWTYSRLYKEERTRHMDQQDRQLMNTWKSGDTGRQMPPVIVEVAKRTPSVESGAEESAFKERWHNVLKRPPSPKQS
jgi:hypothetical protein